MPRILVIDDDETTRNLLRAILEPAGHQVLEAKNGKEGVGLFRREVTDLVITDIIMPEEDGLETIRNLRQTHPTLKIIAMTGYDTTGEMGYFDLAKKYGAVHALGKPLHKDDILTAVSACLE